MNCEDLLMFQHEVQVTAANIPDSWAEAHREQNVSGDAKGPGHHEVVLCKNTAASREEEP